MILGSFWEGFGWEFRRHLVCADGDLLFFADDERALDGLRMHVFEYQSFILSPSSGRGGGGRGQNRDDVDAFRVDPPGEG